VRGEEKAGGREFSRNEFSTFSGEDPGLIWHLLRVVLVNAQRVDTGAAGTQLHWALGTGHWALGTGHWALGTGHWALGTGHWALGTWFHLCSLPSLPFPLGHALSPSASLSVRASSACARYRGGAKTSSGMRDSLVSARCPPWTLIAAQKCGLAVLGRTWCERTHHPERALGARAGVEQARLRHEHGALVLFVFASVVKNARTGRKVLESGIPLERPCVVSSCS
jgi:hypothetical protein